MDFFESLASAAKNRQPAVWISRIVLFSQIRPKPDVIREINLNRGINIVWAEETEDDNPETVITGHSAGKTTFCRLLRYLLGEKNFGRKKDIKRISDIFPNGYIGGEIHVYNEQDGRDLFWAVIRPIGTNKRTYVLENGSIEQLVENPTTSVSQDLYSKKLGFENLLNKMGTATIVRTDEIIKWGHLLSWCTRDQENRFQNIHEWRSPRSESEAPSFKFPKDGPLFVMRTALGLFLPDELVGEENIAGMQKGKDNLEKRLEKLKQEPLFRTNLYRDQLKDLIKENSETIIADILPDFDQDQQSLFPESLEGFVRKAIEKAETEKKDSLRQSTDLQNRIYELELEIRKIKHKLGQVGSISTFEDSKKREPDPIAILKDRMDEFRYRECLGGEIYNECEKFNRRYSEIDITNIIDARFKKAELSKINSDIQRLKEEEDELRERLVPLEEKLMELKKELLKISSNELETRTYLKTIEKNWNDFFQWHQIYHGVNPYDDLTSTAERIAELETKIAAEKIRLSNLIREHDENRNLLSQIFSHGVKSVLASGTYDGEFKLIDRELFFGIKQNAAMSGEAIETLSVLLTDISCLIYNAVSKTSALPGFLLHDSPREADLGLRIYRSFIRFAEKLHNTFGGENQCPFQYILTTTTSPPKELRGPERVKLPLDASNENGLLLRKYIFPKDETTDQIEHEMNHEKEF